MEQHTNSVKYINDKIMDIAHDLPRNAAVLKYSPNDIDKYIDDFDIFLKNSNTYDLISGPYKKQYYWGENVRVPLQYLMKYCLNTYNLSKYGTIDETMSTISKILIKCYRIFKKI